MQRWRRAEGADTRVTMLQKIHRAECNRAFQPELLTADGADSTDERTEESSPLSIRVIRVIRG